MSLIISLRKGQEFTAGHTLVQVKEVFDNGDFVLHVVGGVKDFTITDEQAEEVLPDVYVAAGRKKQLGLACLSISAPPDIRLERVGGHGAREHEHHGS